MRQPTNGIDIIAHLQVLGTKNLAPAVDGPVRGNRLDRPAERTARRGRIDLLLTSTSMSNSPETMSQALEMDTAAPPSSTTLCLACSASLPPRRAHSSASASSEPDNDIFFTPCCNRPICPSCLASNPRLRRYNPCLHCLGGVGVVRSRTNLNLLRSHLDAHDPAPPQNIDGGVHDADVYVLGDEDEDEDDGDVPIRSPESATRTKGPTSSPPESGTRMTPPPPPYTAQSPSEMVSPQIANESTKLGDWSSDAPMQMSPKVAAPAKYYIKPGDTLVGISLKYGIDVRLRVTHTHL